MSIDEIIEFVASITLLSCDHGGRRSAPELGYRPSIQVNGKQSQHSCVLLAPASFDSQTLPINEPFECCVRMTKEAGISLDIEVSQNFTLMEGKRAVGKGTVLTVR